MEDGNLDYKPNSNLINYQKLLFISSILFCLEKCKKHQYNFTPISVIQDYVKNYECLSEDEQKSRSRALQEPQR